MVDSDSLIIRVGILAHSRSEIRPGYDPARTFARVNALFRELAQESVAKIIDRIAAEVKCHISGSDQCDDTTLVVIKRKEVRPAKPVARGGTGARLKIISDLD